MRFFLPLLTLIISFYFFVGVPMYALQSPKNINVYVIGVIDPTIKNFETTKSQIENFNTQSANFLSNASAYKGYKDPLATPYLDYQIFGSKYIEGPVELGLPLSASSNRPNYRYYLERENICDLVDNKGIKQVWFWTQHSSNVVPVESNMSMGTKSSKYFNRVGYGDISNSERTNDLPVCNKTYTLFNYNYNRGVPEMIENHAHQLEYLFEFLDRSLFWENFVGSKVGSDLIYNPGCGWTHYPPNGVSDYDWYNKNKVLSDCEDWNPNGSGAKKLTSCETWSKSSSCPRDGGLSFKLWWMQNLPGENNNLSFQGKPLINWWEVVYDLDSVLANESGLYVPQSTTPTPTPKTSTPTPTPTPRIPTPTALVPTPTPLSLTNHYDINNDKKEDMQDVILVIQAVFNNFNNQKADVNGDGKKDILDLIKILQEIFSGNNS